MGVKIPSSILNKWSVFFLARDCLSKVFSIGRQTACLVLRASLEGVRSLSPILGARCLDTRGAHQRFTIILLLPLHPNTSSADAALLQTQSRGMPVPSVLVPQS